MENYETRELAQAKCDKMNEAQPQWFCPLINRQCTALCICFERATVSPTYFELSIVEAHCDNRGFGF